MDIFTPADKVAIDTALSGMEPIKELLRRAKSADIDVATEEKRLQEQEQRLRKIRDAFFPNG